MLVDAFLDLAGVDDRQIRPLPRGLKTGNLTLIRNAAAELPRVDLGDALAVCVAIRQAEPDRFQRAALRWLARFWSSDGK